MTNALRLNRLNGGPRVGGSHGLPAKVLSFRGRPLSFRGLYLTLRRGG